MYNRYIPNGASYTRVSQPEEPAPGPEPRAGGKKPGALAGLLRALKLEELDSGDVLVLLILLLLALEGEDSLELLLALAVLLLPGPD